MNFLSKVAGKWVECDRPKWIDTSGWPYQSVHVVRGKKHEYYLEGAFTGQDVSKCYKRRR
jgi:hypothetical protein